MESEKTQTKIGMLSYFEEADIKGFNSFLHDKTISFNASSFDRIILNNDGQLVSINGNVDRFKGYFSIDLINEFFNHHIWFDRLDRGMIIVLSSNNTTDNERELIYYSNENISAAISALKLEDAFTPTEFDLLLDLITGISAKESAERDHVSYHTRRNQVKSILDKTEFNSQTELTSNCTILLISYLFRENEDLAKTQKNEITDYSPEYFESLLDTPYRLHNIQIDQDKYLRVLDMGPLDAKPVIMCHGNILPIKRAYQSLNLVENNLRILIPLRCGYLQKFNKLLPPDEYIARSVLEIEKVIEIFSLSDVTVLSLASGVVTAMHLQKRNNKSIEKFVLLSGTHTNSFIKNSLAKKFRDFVLKNATKKNFLIRTIMEYYTQKLKNEKIALNAFLKVHQGSKTDQFLIKKAFQNYDGHRFFTNALALSWECYIMDQMVKPETVWLDLDKINYPMIFIHGDQNPIDNIETIKSISAKIPNSKLVTLEGKGQFLIFDEIEDWLIEAIR